MPEETKRQYNHLPLDLKQMSKDTGISYATLYFRWKKGYPLHPPTVRKYEAFKRKQTMKEWARELGRESKGLYDRVRYYHTEYEMTEKEALEHVLTNGGITK